MTPDTNHPTDTEVAAHTILDIAGTFPGRFGRLRTARIVGGFSVPIDDSVGTDTAPYAGLVRNWTLGDLVALVDALLAGGLMAQTTGSRPTLVLTRAGHRALDALENLPAPPVADAERYAGPCTTMNA